MAFGLLGSFLSPACIGDSVPNEGGKLIVRPGKKWLHFGDSITGSNWKYWAYLETSVGLFYSSRGLTALTHVNAGVNGDDTAAALARVSTAVVAEAPDLVTIFLGINDVSGSVPPATAASNMSGIISTIQAGVPNVAIMGIGPWINGDGRPNGTNLADTNINNMNTALRNVFVGTYGLPWVDVRGYFFAEPDSAVVTDLSLDGVHPFEKGKAWLSAQVEKHLILREQ